MPQEIIHSVEFDRENRTFDLVSAYTDEPGHVYTSTIKGRYGEYMDWLPGALFYGNAVFRCDCTSPARYAYDKTNGEHGVAENEPPWAALKLEDFDKWAASFRKNMEGIW